METLYISELRQALEEERAKLPKKGESIELGSLGRHNHSSQNSSTDRNDDNTGAIGDKKMNA